MALSARGLLSWLLVVGAGALGLPGLPISSCQNGSPQTAYDFSALAIDEKTNVSLSAYKGKVLIVTNVATYWGQYEDT